MKGVLVFFCVAVAGCLGYNIDACDSNKQLQVDETRRTVLTLTCSGITHDRMVWKLRHTDGTESQIGTCTRSTRNCSDTDSSYTLSRTQNSTSQLTITHDHRNKIAGTVTCAGLYGGSLVNATTCDVRVVYTDYTVTNCQTSVSTTKDWTVNGSCDVTKIFASDRRYSCYWRVGTKSDIIPGQVGLTTFTVSGKEYRKVKCSFTGQPLPSEDGTYSYTVTIDPAGNPNERHVGKPLIIASAKGPPVLHSCPDYVIEGDDAHCTCQASASEPPAVVIWSSGINDVVSNTSTLTLSNVSRSQKGQNYTCKQYWGGFGTGHVKTAVYMVKVRYPPPSPPVIQGTLNYTEGDSLHLTCTVTGGNPPVADVALSCGTHSDAEVTATTSSAEQRVKNITISHITAEDHDSLCVCSATWKRRPSLYTSTSTVTIVVQASSSSENLNKEDGDNSLLPIAGGAAGAAVVFIIVIVIIVVIFRRRRRDKKQSVDGRNNSPRAENDEEFEEHINMTYESADDIPLPQTKPSAVALRIPAPTSSQPDSNEADAVEDIDADYTSISPQALRSSGPERRNLTEQEEEDDGLYSTADEPAAAGDDGDDDDDDDDDDADNQAAGGGSSRFSTPASTGRRNAGAHAAVINQTQTQPDLHNNEYAVVNKLRKKTNQPTNFALPGDGDENPAQDVYAEVNKKPKGGKPPSSELPEEEAELGAHAQKPKTSIKPAPAVKPKPAVAKKPPVPGKPRQSDISNSQKSRLARRPLTDGYEDVDLQNEADTADISPEDEYNTLAFHRPPPTEPPGNPEDTYSHIGASSLKK